MAMDRDDQGRDDGRPERHVHTVQPDDGEHADGDVGEDWDDGTESVILAW